MIEVSWPELKSMVDSGQVRLKYIERTVTYEIYGFDSNFSVHHSMDRNPTDTTHLDEFEASYKTNTTLDPTDTDGASLNRTKMTKSGNHYQSQYLEVCTSDLSSVYNKDKDGNDLGFANIKLYNASDVEITDQPTANTDAVKTVLTWESDHDVDIIGGFLRQKAAPTTDVRLWVTAVPQVPKASGGSIEFCTGGLNLKRLGTNTHQLEGETTKTMPYDATYHTSEFEFTIKHDAGVKHYLAFEFRLFKNPLD